MIMLTISEASQLDFGDFVATFENVVEKCPVVVAGVYDDRPFESVDTFHKSITTFVKNLCQKGQIGILRCHPDLAGKIAALGQLTTESTEEQKAAGLDDITDEEKVTMDQLNAQYKAKFGFPFVICARENKKNAILKGMAERLLNDRHSEVETGIEEVLKICRLRLNNIVSDN
ncbi:2-oxo-4-hydroxy-4-carboxy-5-ureidoimidazoline decarboxylase-like [Watersipora subatra]|uniref:2-oxo-4-hydroxy-4-carboxy-5-ureidoimidazoline decarboxylase-like n=1 Tax=Watersipora subatra TaxID=2589382 RepID=UPI00355C8ADD